MIYAKCDRCGADVESLVFRYRVRSKYAVAIGEIDKRFSDKSRQVSDEFDMCEKCCDAVREFIRGNDG